MTTAHALNTLPYPEPPALRKDHLRLLRSDAAPKVFAQSAKPTVQAPRRAGTEVLVWVLLAAGIHAVIVAGVWNRDVQPRVLRAPQEIELLRPPPAVVPEERHRIDPPKAAEPQKQAAPPQAALRTAVAEEPQPNTMSVTENLTAPKTSGPVAAVPTAPAHAEEPVTEPTGYAGYLNNPAPQYPKAAQRLGMQGRVVLRVRVLASGRVGEVEIRQSSGKAMLDEAAQAAVRAWTFAPAKRGNTPIDAWAQVPIDFKLAP